MSRPQTQPADAAMMTATELQATRLETDAERILETVMHRRHWAVKDRDALAREIMVIVEREIRTWRQRQEKAA